MDPKLLRSLMDNQKENEDTVLNTIGHYRRRLRCRDSSEAATSQDRRTEEKFGQALRSWFPSKRQSRDILSLVHRHTVCNRFLRYSVTASITVTRGAGGFAINPSLQFRRVVAWDSPAFGLLRKVHIGWSDPTRPSVIQDTHRALFALFEARLASPTDTLENGETLLHVCTTDGHQQIATNDVIIECC
jgi:hypothetical protein